MLKRLNEKNESFEIHSVNSNLFSRYGNILEDCDFSDMFPHSIASMDLSGPTYIRDIEALHKYESLTYLKDCVFGGIDLQAGLCFGNNIKMNAMEFHKSSEVIIAITDMILILGDIRDMENNSWDSALAECFLIPEGTAIELYGGTLHLAPCRVSAEPFCSIIVLPEGTNAPLPSSSKVQDPLLFMKNKWLICHEESPAVARGGVIGITGENIQIDIRDNYIKSRISL